MLTITYSRTINQTLVIPWSDRVNQPPPPPPLPRPDDPLPPLRPVCSERFNSRSCCCNCCNWNSAFSSGMMPSALPPNSRPFAEHSIPFDRTPRIFDRLSLTPSGNTDPTGAKGYFTPAITFDAPHTTSLLPSRCSPGTQTGGPRWDVARRVPRARR